MTHWVGATGVCINSDGQVLMVLQGKPEEEKYWSVSYMRKRNQPLIIVLMLDKNFILLLPGS